MKIDQLITRLSNPRAPGFINNPIPKVQVRMVLNRLIDVLNTMEKDESVFISGLGTFRMRHYKAKKVVGFDKKTYDLPSSTVLTFRMSRSKKAQKIISWKTGKVA